MNQTSKLFNSVTSTTANGAVTHNTSNNRCVDLFFMIGSSRGKDISQAFQLAYQVNPKIASRILLYARDIRKGMGERQIFKDLVKYIDDPEIVCSIILKIPELGRFDDLHVFMDTPYEKDALTVLVNALVEGNQLAAKWTPRKGPVFNKLRKFIGIPDPKLVRKMLVGLSNTVEQKMCAKLWSQIEYSHVPSVASIRYRNAFDRNDEVRYEKYKESLSKGEPGVKINAGAIYPHDIISEISKKVRVNWKGSVSESSNLDMRTFEAQWKALPNFMGDTNERIIPVVDVSGSMGVTIGGGSSTQCIDVAVALGMYLAERNEGCFQNQIISFSGKPNFHHLVGDLKSRYVATMRSGEDMSTNIQGVFDKVLSTAVANDLTEEDMPTMLLILSDMEFNSCGNRTNFDTIKRKYRNAGYTMPKLVFWNLHARAGNVPVKAHESGAALVSGFSPSIMTSILKGEMTPEGIMLKAIMDSRYDI